MGGDLALWGGGAAQGDGLVGALHAASPELVAEVHETVLILGNDQQPCITTTATLYVGKKQMLVSTWNLTSHETVLILGSSPAAALHHHHPNNSNSNNLNSPVFQPIARYLQGMF